MKEQKTSLPIGGTNQNLIYGGQLRTLSSRQEMTWLISFEKVRDNLF